jgi:hypothetical protein
MPKVGLFVDTVVINVGVNPHGFPRIDTGAKLVVFFFAAF